MTFITVCLKVSCLFRFTPAANLVAHGLQLSDGAPYNMLERIRKFVTYIYIYREPTENREFNYRGYSNPLWIIGLSGPISESLVALFNLSYSCIIVQGQICIVYQCVLLFHVLQDIPYK